MATEQLQSVTARSGDASGGIRSIDRDQPIAQPEEWELVSATPAEPVTPDPTLEAENAPQVHSAGAGPALTFSSFVPPTGVSLGKLIHEDGSKTQRKFPPQMKATTTTGSLFGLAAKLRPNIFLTSGVFAEPEVLVVPKGMEVKGAKFPVRNRGKEQMQPPPGQALQVIDNDFATEQGVTRAELLAALPELVGVAMLEKGSSGSYINCTPPRGCKGEHIFMVAASGLDIDHNAQIIHKRLVLAGFDRSYVGGAGQFLQRSACDQAVRHCWQPVFLGADLDPGLVQDFKVRTFEGGVLPRLPDLTAEQDAEFRRLVAEKRNSLIPEMARNRAVTLDRMVTEGTPRADAVRALTGGWLGRDMVIHLADGKHTPVMVGDILDNPGQYEGVTTLDPLEPDYRGYQQTGILYLNGRDPVLISQARGKVTYKLGVPTTAAFDFADELGASATDGAEELPPIEPITPDDVVVEGEAPRQQPLNYHFDPAIRASMNSHMDMLPSLNGLGYEGDGPRLVKIDGKVASLAPDGTWSINGTPAVDAATLFVHTEYSGDAISAQADWKKTVAGGDLNAQPWNLGLHDGQVPCTTQYMGPYVKARGGWPESGVERWSFKPIDMAKVMREEPKPIDWLFHQRVPGNRGALLTGLGGTSKTQMLYQMAIAAILGNCPWGWAVDKLGKALLILTEDDENDPHITLHTIKMAMGLSAEQNTKIEDGLIVYPLAGEELKLLIRDPDSKALVQSGYFKALEETIKAAGDVVFVGIDPALGVTEGDEASQTDQRALGRMADSLAVRCGCAVVILTHGTKGSLQSDEINSHSSRGGGAITDAVRAEYGMRTMTVKEAQKYGVQDLAERESYVQMKCTKGNRIPPEAKVPVWFHRGRGGFLEVVELVEVKSGGISPLAKRALDVMAELDRDNKGVRLQDWRQRCVDKKIIGAVTPESVKKAMEQILKGLGGNIVKGEERGIYSRNFATFDDELEDAE